MTRWALLIGTLASVGFGPAACGGSAELSNQELADQIAERRGVRLECGESGQLGLYGTDIELNRECFGPGYPHGSPLYVRVSGESWCVVIAPDKDLPICADALDLSKIGTGG